MFVLKALVVGVLAFLAIAACSAGTTAPLVDSTQVECAAEAVSHFDAKGVMTDDEHEIRQTFTVAGQDTRIESSLYEIDGLNLVGKVDAIWKDGVQYTRHTGESEDSPRTWEEWEIVSNVTGRHGFRPYTQCLEPTTTSSDRHFVAEIEYYGDIVSTDEFWVNPDGLPVRWLSTDIVEATGDVQRVIDVTFSGFGETNAMKAPVTPPTRTPLLLPTQEPTVPEHTAGPESGGREDGTITSVRKTEVDYNLGREFASVSAGDLHTCGVRTDGSLACWGHNHLGQALPPQGEFASVSAGYSHTCGVRDDGSVACWGSNGDGQASAPAGTFSSVSAGLFHTCGVRDNGSVACWGDNDYGEASPPQGEFLSVSAGGLHTCGVRDNGSVACWGLDELGEASPLQGEFATVSAGRNHTCGVMYDGSVECWGNNDDGRTWPPAGEFASVSAGHRHTCGMRADGSVACWGYNHDGQASPPLAACPRNTAGEWFGVE